MGRFLVGFGIGVLVGVGIAVLTAPRSGKPQGFGKLIDGALGAARRASTMREQELWTDYRARLTQPATPTGYRPQPY